MPVTWTGERTIPERCTTLEEVTMYHRHLAAYEHAASLLKPGTRLLDIGCGTGYGTRALADGGADTVGIDVDPSTVDHARLRYAGPRARYATYDGRTLPFGAASFDAAVSFQVIEHVRDDDRFVSEARRVVKSSGWFLVTTPNRSLRLHEGQRPWNRFHLREYASEQLVRLLSRHFDSVTMLGITAAEPLLAFERDRIAWAQRTVRRDPLNLRRLIPDRLKPAVVQALKSRALLRGAKPGDRQTLESGRYWVTEDPQQVWLDLLAICHSSRAHA